MNKAAQNDNKILEAPKSKDEYVNGLKIAIDILETYPEDKREVQRCAGQLSRSNILQHCAMQFPVVPDTPYQGCSFPWRSHRPALSSLPPRWNAH